MGTLSGPGRAAAALVALVAWAGLAVQFEASLAGQGTLAKTLWVMLRYFTVIANLLLALVASGIALGSRHAAAPLALGGVTIAMMLVGIVYALLLRGLLELSGGARLADFLLHTVTPVLAPAFWLLFADKGRLSARAPWLWAMLPLAYFAYALIRGAAEGVYAYPFMNVDRFGFARVLVNGVAMAAAFLAAGYGVVWLDRRMVRAKQP